MKPVLLLLCMVFTIVQGDGDPPGHLQPLGSHQAPEHPITVLLETPSPRDFFENFVKPGRPVVFKGAAKNMPAYSRWTDEYLSKKFGSLKMDVEEGKKENRSWGTFNFKLQDFIKRYKTEDVYMVESLPKEMQEEYMLIKSLHCGGFTDVLQDAVMWFSSGGTKSVLHFDAVENINCLFSGSKKFVMIDKKFVPQAHIDRIDGSYSSVDVEKVDMHKFPGLQNIPWYNVSMMEGDCLYIPYMWIHHVHSFGSRNLAINIWWAHFSFFNESDCQDRKYKDSEYLPISSFAFKPMETTRQQVLEEMGREPVKQEEWIKISQKLATDLHLQQNTKEALIENFQELDKNKDGFVSAEEILGLESSDIKRLLVPGLIPEADEEEEEEDAEDAPTKEEEIGGTEESPVDKIVKAENERLNIKEEL